MQIFLNRKRAREADGTWDLLNRNFTFKSLDLTKDPYKVRIRFTRFSGVPDAPEFKADVRRRNNRLSFIIPNWSTVVGPQTWVHDCIGPQAWTYNTILLDRKLTIWESSDEDTFFVNYRSWSCTLSPQPLREVFELARGYVLKHFISLGERAAQELSWAPPDHSKTRFTCID